MEYAKQKLAEKLNLNPADIKDLKPIESPGCLEDMFLMTYIYKGIKFITNGSSLNKTLQQFRKEISIAFGA